MPSCRARDGRVRSRCRRGAARQQTGRPHRRSRAEESAVLSGGTTGAHKIEGIGAGFVVPLWDPAIVDEIAAVSTAEAMAMARQLARADALFAGIPTGANLVAAIELGKRLGKDATIVTVMCDSGISACEHAPYTITVGRSVAAGRLRLRMKAAAV